MNYEQILKSLGYSLPIPNLQLSPITVIGSTTVLSVVDTTTGDSAVYVIGAIRGVVLVSGSPLLPTIDKQTTKLEPARSEPEDIVDVTTKRTSTEKEIIPEEEISTDSDTDFVVQIEDGTIIAVPANGTISTMNGGVLAMKIKSIRKTHGQTAKILNSVVPDKYRV